MSRIRVSTKRKAPTATTLENIYQTIRAIVVDCEAYYSEEQLDRLKKDGNAVFVERKGK